MTLWSLLLAGYDQSIEVMHQIMSAILQSHDGFCIGVMQALRCSTPTGAVQWNAPPTAAKVGSVTACALPGKV